MTSREELYNSERGEREYYLNSHTTATDQQVLLPLTRDGFEALLERVASFHKLPIDDRLRSLLAGYVHHIPSDEMTLNLTNLSKAVYKSFSNSLTYEIDQEAKARALKEAQKKLEETPSGDGKVLPMNGA